MRHIKLILSKIHKDSKYPLKKLLNIIAPVLPDKLFLQIAYLLYLGKFLNLKNPKTYNEKLQWLKLYNRNPEYTKMVDKYEAKKYVSSIIGEEHIIPTLGIYDTVDEIPWDSLPNQFVLKCSHDSGGLVICQDKSKLDIKAAKRKLKKSLSKNYYSTSKEWPYKNVKRRLIIEKYMVDESGYELKDYKFFCFNGKVKCLKVDFNRAIDHHANYYDENWNLLKFGESEFPPVYSKKIEKPVTLKTMITLAERISKDIPFVRVDFYSIKNKVFFGEITFYPASGIGKLTSDEWDKRLGSWIKLPI